MHKHLKKIAATTLLLPMLVACSKGSDSKSSTASSSEHTHTSAPAAPTSTDAAQPSSDQSHSQPAPSNAQESLSSLLESAKSAVPAVPDAAGGNYKKVYSGTYSQNDIKLDYTLGKGSESGVTLWAVTGTAEFSGTTPALYKITFDLQDSSGSSLGTCEVPYPAAVPTKTPFAQVCQNIHGNPAKATVKSISEF